MYDEKYTQGISGWMRAYLPRFRLSLLKRKPRLFSTLIMAILRRRLFNDKRLLSLDYGFSAACNLKCEHCFSTGLRNTG